jgi:hypothetical protein
VAQQALKSFIQVVLGNEVAFELAGAPKLAALKKWLKRERGSTQSTSMQDSKTLQT